MLYSNKCLLLKRESERNVKHILNDEDPNVPKVFSKDSAETFQEVNNLLSDKIADEDFIKTNFIIRYPSVLVYEHPYFLIELFVSPLL